MLVKKFLSITLIAVVLSICPSARAADSRALPASEKALIANIARDGMLEVRLGNIAIQNGKSQSVKAFARQMVAEHSHCNEKLKAAALLEDVKLPTSISDQQQEREDRLAALTGAEFDRKYMAEMLAAQIKAAHAVKKESENGSGQFKIWATNTLPVIEHHLSEVRHLKTLLPSKNSIASSEQDDVQ